MGRVASTSTEPAPAKPPQLISHKQPHPFPPLSCQSTLSHDAFCPPTITTLSPNQVLHVLISTHLARPYHFLVLVLVLLLIRIISLQ